MMITKTIRIKMIIFDLLSEFILLGLTLYIAENW